MRERGQSIVELALVLPLLLIVLLGLLDLGRVYYVMVALEDMAAEGVSYATIHPTEVDEVQLRAAAGSSGLVTVVTSTIRMESTGMAPGDTVTVTVPFSYTFVTPFVSEMFDDGLIVLEGTATGVIISE
ncbi:MAG: pilus assembly protein [Anaerolineae bacterium]|nr:pilus assembly protein [Anaerolineae bacterium]